MCFPGFKFKIRGNTNVLPSAILYNFQKRIHDVSSSSTEFLTEMVRKFDSLFTIRVHTVLSEPDLNADSNGG